MNRLFSKIAILSSVIQSAIFAHNTSMNIMLFDGLSIDDKDHLIANIEQIKPTTLVAYKCNCFEADEASSLKDYPFVYSDDQLEDLKIISAHPLDHIVIYKLNDLDFVLELAAEQYSGISYIGHLPTLNAEHLDTLKSYLIATNPYAKAIFWGDLNHNTYAPSPLWELCVKGDAGASAECDTKGNKSAKGDITFKSDDERYRAKGQIEFTENEKGEKVGKAKVEVRVGF